MKRDTITFRTSDKLKEAIKKKIDDSNKTMSKVIVSILETSLKLKKEKK